MKKLFYILPFLCLLLFSCKKQNNSPVSTTPLALSSPIDLEIVDKNGNSIIHSVNDILMVTYVENGVNLSYRMDIFKVQLDVDDTVPIPKYNGFLISDQDFTEQSTGAAFMVSPSAGVGPSTPGSVRNFNFSLNGQSLGSVYFDYWTAWQNAQGNVTNTAFTLNNTPATYGNVTGYLVAGYPALSASNTLQGYIRNLNFTAPTGLPAFILQYNGVIN